MCAELGLKQNEAHFPTEFRSAGSQTVGEFHLAADVEQLLVTHDREAEARAQAEGRAAVAEAAAAAATARAGRAEAVLADLKLAAGADASAKARPCNGCN